MKRLIHVLDFLELSLDNLLLSSHPNFNDETDIALEDIISPLKQPMGGMADITVQPLPVDNIVKAAIIKTLLARGVKIYTEAELRNATPHQLTECLRMVCPDLRAHALMASNGFHNGGGFGGQASSPMPTLDSPVSRRPCEPKGIPDFKDRTRAPIFSALGDNRRRPAYLNTLLAKVLKKVDTLPLFECDSFSVADYLAIKNQFRLTHQQEAIVLKIDTALASRLKVVREEAIAKAFSKKKAQYNKALPYIMTYLDNMPEYVRFDLYSEVDLQKHIKKGVELYNLM